MKVFVRAPIHPDAVAQLRGDCRIETITWDDPEAARWEDEADAVILRGLDITGDEIRRAKRLKVIGRHGAGVDSVDLEAARAKGVVVMNTPFENSRSVAELTVALLMAAARRVVAATRLVETGAWAEGRKGTGCRELYGNTVGFVGFGRIARMTADILRNGFAMRVLAYDPLLSAADWSMIDDQVTPCTEISELFAASDYVSIHVPKTNATAGMISARVFAAAKKGLILVNTARGGVVDEQALYEAMRSGHIGGAAFDVFDREPLDPHAPLLELPNFIATPHYGGATQECLRRVATAIAKETVAALFGEETPAYRFI